MKPMFHPLLILSPKERYLVSNASLSVIFSSFGANPNVPFSETVTIAEALRKNDVYMEQLIFPDEVHSFLLYQNWLNAYKATANFFDKFLKKK